MKSFALTTVAFMLTAVTCVLAAADDAEDVRNVVTAFATFIDLPMWKSPEAPSAS
jgi:hypothetical protein